MRGTGWGAAAISIRNALFDGVGAAAGIELYARATVDLRSPGEAAPSRAGPLAPDPLVQATLRAALGRWSREAWEAEVSVRSDIPIARGLKSSSAVATAVEHAVLHALRRTVPAEEVARLGAVTARAAGFSATGAFDDALASAAPGIHVTDNLRTVPLRLFQAPSDVEVVLWVPDHRHPPSPSLRSRFASHAGESAPGREAALSGDWPGAMELNSELVERTLGYPYAPLRALARDAGALASGVSGMGPALAIVTPSPALAPALRCLPKGGGELIVTRFLREPTEVRP